MTDLDLVDALNACRLSPRREGRGWQSRCPVHDDRTPSLSSRVTQEGKLLLYCHAGCPFMEVLAALGLRNQSYITQPTTLTQRQRIIEERRPDPAVIARWADIARTSPECEVEARERSLGIPLGGLRRIGAAWAVSIGALAAPMMDAPGGSLIGVRLRADDGKKWAVAGSKNGLFTPVRFTGDGPLFMPEGLTDTAALCGLGFDAVGRPSCTGGRDLCRMAALRAAREVVVVTDRDAPGRLGARLLAEELVKAGCRVRTLGPPPGFKDVREWIADGADRADVAYAVRHRGANA